LSFRSYVPLVWVPPSDPDRSWRFAPFYQHFFFPLFTPPHFFPQPKVLVGQNGSTTGPLLVLFFFSPPFSRSFAASQPSPSNFRETRPLLVVCRGDFSTALLPLSTVHPDLHIYGPFSLLPAQTSRPGSVEVDPLDLAFLTVIFPEHEPFLQSPHVALLIRQVSLPC